ncbi:D-erythronate dehydrogenase [Variovorax soli]|uniref:Nucleoside-diphosphate-sugar epimerase n=1 Tax=Variovorax soli TaxID=376815 RepID=A0ABU1N8M1_9BURK|nr:D-erythronate dehydrogenase [Variovorax soli]MDR6534790.1 nucleoside-diphosphate-sugar epimerase [Variovorax soli]
MKILITGGCGFLGARLARTLLAQGRLSMCGAEPRDIARITLADRVPPPADLQQDPRIAFVQGDLNELLARGQGPQPDTALVFHLAAAVSGECEADFDLGMRSNLDATRALLEACRALGTQPVVVFSSSVAVFGSSPQQALPPVIRDDTLPTPQNSYGIQKFIGEQLVADYTRKGFVRGRNVRLMTVSVRPGRPNAAASSFLSGILREPLAGVRARCPVPPETAVALSSPAATVAGILRAAEAGDGDWGARTAVNLPALTISVRGMVEALERVAGPAAAALIDWEPDPSIAAIVTSWPSRIDSARAAALGLRADASFDDVIRAYIHENRDAVKLPLERS